MSNIEHIFIVGNSRSGTTMMGRILSRNTSVFTFKELHFFGNIFSSDDKKILKETESEELLSKLLCIQEHGIFNFKDYKKFNKISKRILKRRDYTSIEIFKFFLNFSFQNCLLVCGFFLLLQSC